MKQLTYIFTLILMLVFVAREFTPELSLVQKDSKEWYDTNQADDAENKSEDNGAEKEKLLNAIMVINVDAGYAIKKINDCRTDNIFSTSLGVITPPPEFI